MKHCRRKSRSSLAEIWNSVPTGLSSMMIFAVLPHSLAAQTAPHSCNYRYHLRTAVVNGYSVKLEEYQPTGTGRFPLVFMLHGSAGAFTVKSGREPQTDNFGEKRLAHSCFAVVLPHYLEAIGRKSITSRQEIDAQFPAMLSAASVLLADAESLRWVRGEPVYLFGESLGGYLSVALALGRSEVAAASEFSGGLPPGFGLSRRGAFRLLISHGTKDELVPVSEAEALRRFCAAHNIPAQLDLYPGEGHYLSRVAMSRIIGRTIEFFRNRQSRPTSTTNNRR